MINAAIRKEKKLPISSKCDIVMLNISSYYGKCSGNVIDKGISVF